MAKPFESKIQNLVYNVDVGIGLRVIKTGLYLLFILITMLLYTATQFRGLASAEAMDCAQLGRNLARQGRLTTQCLRPASLWYLIEKSPRHNPMINAHPDILHAPLWPAVLASGFKVSGISFAPETAGGVFKPEQFVIIPMCHLFTLLTGGFLFLIARRLFDYRLALLAVTMYFLSDTVWSASISGTSLPLATCLATAAIYAALVAATNRQDGLPRKRWVVPLAACAALCILAFLTRYAALVLAPALAAYLGFAFGKKDWPWAAAFLGVVLAGTLPWVARNVVVSGGPLGLAPYTMFNAAGETEDPSFERQLAPTVSLGRIVGEAKMRAMVNLARYTGTQVRTLGDGLFICLFLTAFFYRFVRSQVHLLRWGVALAAALLLLVAGVFGDLTVRLLQMFWPIVIIYGLAFFFILLDRLQLRVRLFNLGLTTLFIVIGALPLIFTMMPPRAGVPYPPYFPPFVTHVCKMLQPDELLCTDMPWATAWYGDRSSLLLPATIDEFYEINDYTKRISGLYFTTITRNKPYVRGLMTGPERSWFPLLEGRIPSDFPLTQGFPLNNMDQLFLTDRIRWEP